MKRFIALAGCAAGLCFGAGVAESAPRPEPTLVLEPNPVAPGGTFTATLENFCTNDDIGGIIEIEIEGGLGRLVPCRADDLAQATLTAPSSPGEYDVQASAGAILGITTLVVQEDAPGGEPLPETGPQETVAVTAVGGGLLIAGIVLLVTVRTRGRSTR